MNILYISCHESLEYYELKMLHELGHNVFSVGYYVNPRRPSSTTTKPLDFDAIPEAKKHFDAVYANYKPLDSHLELPFEFVNSFDKVIVCHGGYNIIDMAPQLGDKLVIRTITLSYETIELAWQRARYYGAKIVRMSPKENMIPEFAGEDVVIRQCVDTDDFDGWTGEDKNIITVCKWMKKRSWYCEFPFYEFVTSPYERKLIGLANEDIPYAMTDVPFQEMLNHMRRSRVYFSTCTKPAPLTYSFVEALTMGVPIVSIGPLRGSAHLKMFGNCFEVHELIENGVNGFWSDNPCLLRKHIELLFNDYELAKKISTEGKKLANKLFDYETNKEGWKKVL